MFRNRLIKGFTILTSSVILTQLLLVVTSPILTRLYSPDEFGALAVYTSILGILVVLASFRYELALPDSPDEKEEINLLLLSLIIIGINFLLLCFFTYFWIDDFFILIGQEKIIPYKWFIPFGFLFIGIYRVSVMFATKRKSYGDVAKSKIYQSIGMILIQILGYKFGTSALLMGHAVGQSLGVIRLYLKNEFTDNLKQYSSKKNIIEMMYKYAKFPKYSLPSATLNVIGSQLPVIMLSSLFSPAIAGFYALAQRIIFLPATMLTGSIVSILFGEGKKLKSNNKLEENIWYLHKFLSSSTLAMAIAMTFVMPDLFGLIFGSEWAVAGEIAAILMPWFFLVFTMTPIFDTFEAFYNQKIIMLFQFFLSITRILGIYLGYLQNDALNAILYFTIFSIIVYLIFFLVVMKKLRINLLKIFYFYTFQVFAALFVLSPLVLMIFFNYEFEYLKWFVFIPAVVISIYMICYNLKSIKKLKA